MSLPTTVAIAAYLRRSITHGRDHDRIGPFIASWSRSSGNPFLNYAIPHDGAAPTAADVTGLIDAYEARGLAPRLEYLPELAPSVEARLLAAGFAVEGRLALMTAGPAREATAPDGIELVFPGANEDLLGVRFVQREAYDDPEPVDEAAVERLRRNLDEGAGAILARVAAGREPVGAGEFTAPDDGVTEITSIAVRPAWRRRGIAAAITSRLLDDARCAGVTTTFLMANEAEARVYARVGFVRVGDVLHISRPAPDGPSEPADGSS